MKGLCCKSLSFPVSWRVVVSPCDGRCVGYSTYGQRNYLWSFTLVQDYPDCGRALSPVEEISSENHKDTLKPPPQPPALWAVLLLSLHCYFCHRTPQCVSLSALNLGLQVCVASNQHKYPCSRWSTMHLGVVFHPEYYLAPSCNSCYERAVHTYEGKG